MRSRYLDLQTSFDGAHSALGTSAIASAAPSPSPAKRKRDQMEQSSMPDARSLKPFTSVFSDNLFPMRADGKQTHFVTASGDVIRVSGREISCFSKVFRHRGKSGRECTGTLSRSCGHFVYVGSSADPSVEACEVVCIGADGSIVFWKVSDLQQSRPEVHKLLLSDENEQVSCALETADGLILGTTTGDSYIVQRQGREVTAEKLQASSSLFFDLLQTGARLIGISSGQAPALSPRLVRLLAPECARSCLITFGAKLRVWLDFGKPGKERITAESSILLEIKRDVGAQQGGQQDDVCVVDACVLQTGTRVRDHVLMVTLSLSAPNAASETASLWMHLVELTLEAAPQTNPVRILQRIILSTEAAVAHDDIHAHSAPHIHSMDLSWRLFVTFAHARSQTMHCAHIDVVNLSTSPAAAALTCGSHDSGMAVSQLLAAHAVKGVDGVCLVVGEESGATSALCFCPPVFRAPSPSDSVVVKDTVAGLTTTFTKKHVSQLLWSLASGDVLLDASLSELRNAFSSWRAVEVLETVMEVSDQLLALAPDGRLWGVSSSMGSGLETVHGDRMQLAGALVRDKLDRHQRLLKAVQAADAFYFEEVAAALLESHQKLLLCAGLSRALQDLRVRLDGLAQDSDRAYVGAMLGLISEAFKYAVEHIQRASLQDIAARGMTVIDQFYTDAGHISENLRAFAHVLTRYQKAASAKDPALAARLCHTVMSTLLSAVQVPLAGPGCDSVKTSIVCRNDLRSTLTEVAAAYAAATETYGTWPAGLPTLTEEREGVRISDFGQIILRTFEQELTQFCATRKEPLDEGADIGHQAMSATWRRQYQVAKEHCVDLLLHLRFAHSAFRLSSRFLYFGGLCRAVDLSPRDLFPQLLELFVHKGHLLGTDQQSLAATVFLHLERQGRGAEILKLGSRHPAQLQAFLQTRPQLAWVRSLGEGAYDAALVSLVDSAREQPEDAHSRHSLAKLCGHMHRHGKPRAIPPATVAASSSASTGAAVTPAQVAAAQSEIQAALVSDRAHEVLLSMAPHKQAELAGTRLKPAELVQEIVAVLREQREEDPSPASLSPDAIARLASVALVVLGSMRCITLRRLDALQAQPGVVPIEVAQAEADRAAALVAQLAEQVWHQVLLCSKVSWMELAALPDVGMWVEYGLRRQIVFYAVTVMAATELDSPELLLPSDPAALSTLLEQSRLAFLCMDEQTGRLSEAAQENPRVKYVVRAIADLALHAQAPE